MNLEDKPTKAQLITLISECDDENGDHILWVDILGNVKIATLYDKSPVEWARDFEGICKFRFETWVDGFGYTGKKASQDDSWINRIFDAITENWVKGTTGYVDTY